ncbi:winged helix-turn-helix transcriptional regulator [Actinocrinis puniceicyclus]|uniref:Winged helix-turn-helix transcriptional regulator n=1 Tax=Actinocrinis puniceicyclus TaxID=977794 RepID=A0A8J8BCW7_9ACTN|nr:MarR family winged helix-turn-helix transcriptional regulator [Actinocrinis puniceicyclus]MBS2964628.1 winged helix-turn-helix transcriptional regulator [Actinocrinis puniceicyclus]
MPTSWTPRGAVDQDSERVIGELLTASRLLVAIAARSLAAVEESLTLPQYRMLVVLDAQGPSSLARMAENLDVNPSTALRMVERLSASGMVEKIPNPKNRREVRLRLTPSGWEVVRQVTENRRKQMAAIVEALDPQAREDLITALRKFTEAGGEPPNDVPGLPGWH